MRRARVARPLRCLPAATARCDGREAARSVSVADRARGAFPAPAGTGPCRHGGLVQIFLNRITPTMSVVGAPPHFLSNLSAWEPCTHSVRATLWSPDDAFTPHQSLVKIFSSFAGMSRRSRTCLGTPSTLPLQNLQPAWYYQW